MSVRFWCCLMLSLSCQFKQLTNFFCSVYSVPNDDKSSWRKMKGTVQDIWEVSWLTKRCLRQQQLNISVDQCWFFKEPVVKNSTFRSVFSDRLHENAGLSCSCSVVLVECHSSYHTSVICVLLVEFRDVITGLYHSVLFRLLEQN